MYKGVKALEYLELERNYNELVEFHHLFLRAKQDVEKLLVEHYGLSEAELMALINEDVCYVSVFEEGALRPFSDLDSAILSVKERHLV
jgi:hypothetical protein